MAARFELVLGVRPPDTPAVYVAPHRSMFDIPAGVVTFDRLGVKPLLVVSKRQLDKLNLRGWDWPALDLLPIDAGPRGRADLIDHGSAALESGRSVAVMPEGRVIRPDLVQGNSRRTGAAQLASSTGVPVVVLGSAGSDLLWQRGRPTTFASVRRPPVVVLCAEIVRPTGDVESTHALITDALSAAETEARRIASTTLAGR
ncbi:lysophospholipid acyltransferase family protein [Nocardia arizonensis]|uniref:lysophospholipid acyltransferase family protein n=1 Tax=Nocardia arizonensis TaxID=1141647 RepID=UPI0006D08C47|nr:lysophospholipid acyltransferase family protein [Nocardia arizonensis]